VTLAPPVAPAYGRRSAADLLPAIATTLGLPGFGELRLGLPAVDRVCLLIVDGLGAELLRRHASDAPFLTSLAGDLSGADPYASPVPTLSVGFPATTATSMASYGTGLPPGEHGMFGYQVRDPSRGVLLNLLRWDQHTDPLVWQPQPTMFERIKEAGVPGFHVGPGAFSASPLTRAVWRGAEYLPTDGAGALVAGAAEAVRREPRSLTVAYHAAVDRAGHVYGSSSAAWSNELALADRLVERLVAALPEDVLLLVTGDHGMVDVPAGGRIDLDAEPALLDGVELLGGEGRARHVYTAPGALEDVQAAWTALVGHAAWVRSREEAIEAGWFGRPVRPELRERIGDLVVAADRGSALIARKTEPNESRLVGLHGSLHPADLEVPLLASLGGSPLR
jgi:predicted AlkP superfamily pyrophosphatase or phosphodiesterase